MAGSTTSIDTIIQPTRPLVSIVILSYNRVSDLRASLDRLAPLAAQAAYQVIVVDNCSTDGTVDLLSKYQQRYPRLVCVANATNLGVAAGRNAGYRIATGAFVLSLDDDSLICTSDIPKLVHTLEERHAAGIVSPTVVHAVSRSYQNFHGDSVCEVGNFHGSCYLFRRSLLSEIGYLDEQCTFGGEELDFSIRARNAGYQVIYCPQVVARHNSFIRPGRVARARMCRWLFNYVRIHFKHFPWRAALLFSARYTFSMVAAGIRRGDILLLLQIPGTLMSAICSGRRSHLPASAQVVAFYRNPDLRPDMGNVPVFRKLAHRLKAIGLWRRGSAA